MSIEVMAKVYTLAVDQDTRDILMALADHADPSGCGVRPSIARLAWKIGDGTRNARGEYKNHRTVQRRIKELLQKGALILVRKAEFHRATEYRLDLSVFPVKEDFVASGDTFHAENRGDNLSGDKIEKRGDKGVSPEPSFEPNNNNNNAPEPVSESPFSETQTKWYAELNQLTGGYMGGAQEFQDLTEAWQKYPDERRHRDAMRQTTAARSRTARVYLKAFLTFNPDWKPPAPTPPKSYQRSAATVPKPVWESPSPELVARKQAEIAARVAARMRGEDV